MRTVEQVMAAARRQVDDPSRDWTNLCLAFVRTVWGIEPTGIPHANAAWERSEKRHGDMRPAKGSPVYWRVGRYGHVALSAGGGAVFTTDFKRTGKVDVVPIGDITRGWNADYRGWTEDYCGNQDLPVKVPAHQKVSLSQLVEAARKDPGRPQGGTTDGAVKDVKIVEIALFAEGLLRPRRYTRDGSFGSLTVDAYSAWQRRLGYSGPDADGIPGVVSLQRLGKRHRFEVVD